MNYSKNDEQETYRTSQVKKIGMDIILCVKLLGGVAALGASIVRLYPCYNTVTDAEDYSRYSHPQSSVSKPSLSC